MIFGDQLSDRQIFAAIQANGTVKDIGGAVQYYNLRKRWNWGVGAEHMPYLTGGALYRDTTVNDGAGGQIQAYNLYYILQIVHEDIAGMRLEYTFPTSVMLALVPTILGAAFIAAVWPAESAVRGSLVEALEYE